MWRTACLVALSFMLLPLIHGREQAQARVEIVIDISDQSMTVDVHGSTVYQFAVSTGRRGYRTPVGRFRPYLLKRMHYSSKYDNSPMPHSIFFLRGYAIHGTDDTRSLGRPASHGCVRLSPSDARRLFSLVGRYGQSSTRIVVER